MGSIISTAVMVGGGARALIAGGVPGVIYWAVGMAVAIGLGILISAAMVGGGVGALIPGVVVDLIVSAVGTAVAFGHRMLMDKYWWGQWRL